MPYEKEFPEGADMMPLGDLCILLEVIILQPEGWHFVLRAGQLSDNLAKRKEGGTHE